VIDSVFVSGLLYCLIFTPNVFILKSLLHQ
jgi:hypothetical protein